MHTVLSHVAQREGFDLPDDTAKLIANDANGNMRKALLVLEALKMQKCAVPLSLSPSISIADQGLALAARTSRRAR